MIIKYNVPCINDDLITKGAIADCHDSCVCVPCFSRVAYSNAIITIQGVLA